MVLPFLQWKCSLNKSRNRNWGPWRARAEFSGSGQTRPFALVEPHASFTLTSRHSPRQSSHRTRGDAVDVRSLSVFGKKSQMVRRDFSRRVPETFAMLDGRMVDGHADGPCAPRRRCVFAGRGRSRSITGRAGTLVVPLRRGQTAAGAVLNQGTRMSVGLPIAIMADVHYLREAAIRLVACTTMCLMPILANAAQTDAQTPSDPQAYCVNRSADFYLHTGEPCKKRVSTRIGQLPKN